MFKVNKIALAVMTQDSFFLKKAATIDRSDAGITAKKMQDALIGGNVWRSAEGTSFKFRTLLACMGSLKFLAAVVFIPAFMEENADKLPATAVAAATAIKLVIEDGCRRCVDSTVGSVEYDNGEEIFYGGLNRLIGFLMDSDKLSKTAVIEVLQRGLPSTM